MSTLKITVKKKVRSARCLTWERVIVGALCCVINGHTTTTNHWSCIYVRLSVYIVGCYYNTQASMQCFCLYILLGAMMKTVNTVICSWTSMLSLSQDKWLGNHSSHELSSNAHLLHNYYPASLPLVPLQDPTTFILNSELERPQSHLQWEFLNNRIISKPSPALYFHAACLSLIMQFSCFLKCAVPCRTLQPSVYPRTLIWHMTTWYLFKSTSNPNHIRLRHPKRKVAISFVFVWQLEPRRHPNARFAAVKTFWHKLDVCAC